LLTILLLCGGEASAFFYGGKYGSEEEREAVQAAEKAHDHRNYDQAWELGLKAAADHPDSLAPVRVLVATAFETRRISEVLSLFDGGDGTGFEAVKAHYARAWGAVLAGDLRYARPEIVRAIALCKRDEFELRRVFLVVRRMEGEGDKDVLLREYQQFVKDYHDVGLAHLSYVNLYNFIDRGSSRQRRAVEEALAAPEKTPQLYLVATELEEEEDFWFDGRTGLQMVERGIAEFPESAELAIRKSFYLRRLGRADEALAFCQEWHRKAPNHGDFLVHTVEILADLGRWDEAIAASKELAEVTFQPQYSDGQPYRLAELLHNAGRDEEAVEVLNAFIRERPNATMWAAGVQMLTRLQSRRPEQKVRIIPDVPLMRQRGNYCGPATINMVLRHWGIGKSQEEIASRIYTGIAGTPPQVLHHFARSIGMTSVEFKADEQTWKRLLDAGYPILWLQMMGTQGGHYRVITGYDDVMKTWILHDPNDFTSSRLPYDRIDDTWMLPSVRRSIVFVPKDKADDPVLAGLKPTLILFVTNWVLYVATGANLFVGLFPALLVNVACAALLALLIAVLLRAVSFPAKPIRIGYVVGATLLFIVPLNLVVGVLRLNQAVSALLGFHLALLTVIPLLALTYLFRRVTHDYLHPRESIGLWVIVSAMWLARSFLDTSPWDWLAPVLICAVSFPLVLYPRLAIRRASLAGLLGDIPRALELARPHGTYGSNYFSAVSVEIDAHLMRGQYAKLVEVSRLALERYTWPHEHDRALRIHLLLGEVLLAPPAEALGHLEGFLADATLSPRIRTLARGLLLYTASRAQAEAAAAWSAAESDALLDTLDRQTRQHFPGLPISRNVRGRPVQQAVFILALTGAIRIAAARGDEARRDLLWSRWGNRFGMIFFLLKGLDEAVGRPSSTAVPKL
jgi:hypothetical protein